MARKSGGNGRLKQIVETYRITKQSDPKIGWILLGTFLGTAIVLGALAWLLPLAIAMKVMLIILAVTIALAVTSFIFGRRAERAAYAQIAGRPGAAAAVLNSLRGGWFTTPAVAVTKNEDLVHQLVGRPGVVLVAEGSPTRVKHLLANQRKKTERWVPEVPIQEIIVGEGDGEVPLPKLQRTIMKMPKVLRPAEVTEIRRRLDAATKAGNALPVPKGPMPKNARMPRQPRG
jgi:hypothetical protein